MSVPRCPEDPRALSARASRFSGYALGLSLLGRGGGYFGRVRKGTGREEPRSSVSSLAAVTPNRDGRARQRMGIGTQGVLFGRCPLAANSYSISDALRTLNPRAPERRSAT